MKKRSVRKKYLGAFLIALLMLSGGAIALPVSGDIISSDASYTDLNQVPYSSLQFQDLKNIMLPENFDYIKEMNKEFVKDPYFYDAFDALNEGSLTDSLKSGDYKEWGEAFIRLGGIAGDAGIISKEEFEVLRKLKK